MNITTRSALICAASAALMMASVGPSVAADLSGGCACADLEERIATLEANTVRKGNNKVTVEVSGQVNYAMVWHDVDVDAPWLNKGSAVVDNQASPTLFRIRGEAKATKDLSVGYVLEMGVGGVALDSTYAVQSSAAIGVRHSFLYLNSTFGKLSIGHTSQATDGISEITVANTAVAARMLSLQPGLSVMLPGVTLLGISDIPFDGGRMSVVRYDTPTMGGFMASAAMANGKMWDAALRYAGTFGGFTVAAGIGHRVDERLGEVLVPDLKNETTTGSASVKHDVSGLFVSGAYGDQKWSVPGMSLNLKGWHTQFGVERKFSELGNTTFFGEYLRLEVSAGGDKWSPTMYGIGLVQSIDAAALDLYVAARVHQLDIPDVDDIRVFQAGARIKF